MKTWIYAALLFLSAASVASAADNLKAFPPAEEEMVRYVLQLPQQMDESAFKVELLVGKTVQIDAQNRYFFGGQIETETIAGWGFPRYMVRKIGPMAGTLMAIDPDARRLQSAIGLPPTARFDPGAGCRYTIIQPRGVVRNNRVSE